MTEPQQLNRALTFGGAAAISTGLAFAALNFLSLAQILRDVDARLSWLPVLLGGLLILGARALFAELNGMYPSAAGIRLWLSRAMNPRVALIITLTYTSAIALVVAADAFIIGEAIAFTFHNGRLVAIGYVAILLGMATWLNLRGIRLAGAAEQIVTGLAVVLTVLVGVIAIAHPGTAHTSPPVATTTGSLIQAVIFGVFVYAGFEWVTANAEEVVRPSIIPRAMLVAVGVLGVSQALFAVAMGATLEGEQLGSAYPQLLVAQHAIGEAGVLLMLAVTALTAVNTFNAGFATLSRFMYAAAREGKLPTLLTRLNSRAVPHVPVWLLGVGSLALAVIVAFTGSFAVMVSVGAALEATIYAAAGYVVWRLRRSEPAHARPFRLRGGAWPALALMATFGLLALVASVSVGPRVTPVPLAIIVGFTAIVTIYVYGYVPRMERRAAAELAARRAQRAATRATRARPTAVTTSPTSPTVPTKD
jgi:amino acid transporter